MTSELINPPKLNEGSTLGVIATSTPVDAAGDALVERGYRRLRELGFEIVEAANCRCHIGHMAGGVDERVEALHRFFADDGIDGIISFWGGLNTHQMLEHLDWELIAENPKVLVGYSDLTCLTNTITSKTGLVTFQGPGVITFAKPTLFDYSIRYFRKVLMEGGEELHYRPSPVCSDNIWYERDDEKMLEKEAPGWRCFRSGRAEGPIVGGNFGTLLLLAQTPWWPEMQGRVLFVEEDEVESPGTVDRMFTQARQMGVFDEIAGLVIGRFPESVGLSDEGLDELLARTLQGYDVPVMVDVDFGHTDPRITYPLGVRCQIDAGVGELKLVEKWLGD